MPKQPVVIALQVGLLLTAVGLIFFTFFGSRVTVSMSVPARAADERAQATVTKFKEPYVMSFSGKVQLTDSRGQSKAPARQQLLREKAIFETGPSALVQVALTKNERLYVGPNSRVAIPVISWDDGAMERIELEKGTMRLQNLTSSPRLVVTPLSRDSYAEADLVFDLDPAAARLRVAVLEGRTAFRGLENEEFTPLERGEEATFQGVIEGGEIVFDVLLQGRKVARGKVEPKKKSNLAPAQMWWTEVEKIAHKEKAADAVRLKEKARAGAICKSPSARLNECAWVCENNPKKEKKACRLELANVKCVRMKCDANGEWSDRLEIIPSKSPCGVQPKVAACDY